MLYGGDRIPVDGSVLAGSACVDQHQLTGDSTPVTCHPGDDVYATAIVVEGYLRIVATRTGHETQAAQVMALAEATPSTDTRVSNYARKVGNPAVVPTLAVSVAVLAASGSIARTAGILSLDLGTEMRVSTPIVVLRRKPTLHNTAS